MRHWGRRTGRAILSWVTAAAAVAGFATAAGAAVAGSVTTNAMTWSTTNGDILVSRIVDVGDTQLLVLGGNFTSVLTRAGATVAARNFAVLDASSGDVVYAGRNVDSYVRAADAHDGVLYVGGDFGTFAGQSRPRVAALSLSTWALTGFNPGLSGRVKAIVAGPSYLYLGGTFSGVRAYRYSDGHEGFRVSTDCAVHALLLSPDGAALYIGGFQNTTSGLVQHAIAKVDATTGAPDPAFTLALTKDSGGCGGAGSTAYDGENTISLAFDTARNRLLVGNGGKYNTFYVVNPATGHSDYRIVSVADVQAILVLGPTYLLGIHGSKTTHNFIGQYAASNGALLPWDPELRGYQGNADGGNNGVQSLCLDAKLGRMYVAGAFLTQNGTARKSLAVFSYT